MAFPPIRKRSRSGSHNRNAAQATAPLHGATPTNGVRAQLCASAHRARRDARAPAGQVQKRRTLKERSGKECDLGKSGSFSLAPDRYRNGQDIRLGARKRIERVAEGSATFILSLGIQHPIPFGGSPANPLLPDNQAKSKQDMSKIRAHVNGNEDGPAHAQPHIEAPSLARISGASL